MGVKFEDMVIKSMRLYWNKTKNFDGMSSVKNSKYNKGYFDSVGKDMLPADNKLTKPSIQKDDPYLTPNLNPPPNGPIPGENFTSDTKNYPWHRPPEITNIDQAIEASAKQLMSEEGAHGMVTMLQAGMPISSLTDVFVMSGIGAGKWTPDLAILLAGPVSHIIQLMAHAEGIDADLGIDLPKSRHTISYIKSIQEDQNNIKTVYRSLDDPMVVAHMEQQVKGFMGANPMPQAQPQTPSSPPMDTPSVPVPPVPSAPTNGNQ